MFLLVILREREREYGNILWKRTRCKRERESKAVILKESKRWKSTCVSTGVLEIGVRPV